MAYFWLLVKKTFTTESSDYALLDIRSIQFDTTDEESAMEHSGG
jgi:hypothetical protein